MAKLSKRRRSSTSVGRFLLDVIKPTPTLPLAGTRVKEDRTVDSADDTTTTRVSADPPLAKPPVPVACVALQNEDTTEDAIVITALDVVPFCCHADLVTMPRTQLLVVAGTLNAKLPLAMQIDTSPARADASIRHSIELLVGIRTSLPNTQVRRRSHTVQGNLSTSTSRNASTTMLTPKFNGGTRGVPPSPASPLAARSRRSMSFGTPSLAVLREDSEEHRACSPSPSPSPPRAAKRRRTGPDALTVSLAPFDSNPARPITRAQSRRVTPFLADIEAAQAGGTGPSTPTRVVRTRSQPVARGQALPQARTPVRSSHGRAASVKTKSRSKGRSASVGTFAMTSTPKKGVMAAGVNSPRRAVAFRPLLAEVHNINMGVGMTARGARKREESMLDMDEVTFGIDGLTIPMIANPGEDSLVTRS